MYGSYLFLFEYFHTVGINYFYSYVDCELSLSCSTSIDAGARCQISNGVVSLRLQFSKNLKTLLVLFCIIVS